MKGYCSKSCECQQMREGRFIPHRFGEEVRLPTVQTIATYDTATSFQLHIV